MKPGAKLLMVLMSMALLGVRGGGVNQKTYGFILVGATTLGIGKELVSREAIHLRQEERIRTLADRFLGYVSAARSQRATH